MILLLQYYFSSCLMLSLMFTWLQHFPSSVLSQHLQHLSPMPPTCPAPLAAACISSLQQMVLPGLPSLVIVPPPPQYILAGDHGDQGGMLRIRAVVEFPPGVVSFPPRMLHALVIPPLPSTPKVTVSHWLGTRRALKPATIHHGGRETAERASWHGARANGLRRLLAFALSCFRERAQMLIAVHSASVKEGGRSFKGVGRFLMVELGRKTANSSSVISQPRFDDFEIPPVCPARAVVWGHAPIQSPGLFTRWPCPLQWWDGQAAGQGHCPGSSKEME